MSIEQHSNDGSGAPPFIDVSVPGGRSQDINGSDPAAGGGGTAGFSLDSQQVILLEGDSTAWDVVANANDTLSELGQFLEDLNDNPTLRSAATLRSLDRFRDALDRLHADADLNQPVELRLQDVALVARSMLSRLR